MWLWPKRDAEIFDGDDCCCCCGCGWTLVEVEILLACAIVVWQVEDDCAEREEELAVIEDGACSSGSVAIGKEFRASASALKEDSVAIFEQWIDSANNGVVNVGDDDTEVVIDVVVTPMSVTVTTVSISGDESAVNVEFVGVWLAAAVGVDPPPVDNFFSMLAWFSAGAVGEPPRHGKQQRNSVERNIVPRFHD